MIEFSTEILTHFKCNNCKKLLTTGDWEQCTKMFCPYCGFVHYDFEIKPLPSWEKLPDVDYPDDD